MSFVVVVEGIACQPQCERQGPGLSRGAPAPILTRNSPLAEIFHSYLGSNIPTMNSMHGLAVNWILAECLENFTALKFRKDVAENFKSRYT
jgi:hypothetical protein